MRHDDTGSKFANYDERTLEVAAQGESVTLGQNEGTVVRTGPAPSEKMDVLTGPALAAPADDEVAYRADLELQWAPVGDAAGYWVEVASDADFAQMTLSQWGLKETSFHTDDLDLGSYYWRVAALDKFGLPGARSDSWRFHVSTRRDAALRRARCARGARHPARGTGPHRRRERGRAHRSR